MSRPLYRRRWAWVAGMHDVRPETIASVDECADCALSTLADRGLLTTRQLADFQDATGLAGLAYFLEPDRIGPDRWRLPHSLAARARIRNLYARLE